MTAETAKRLTPPARRSCGTAFLCALGVFAAALVTYSAIAWVFGHDSARPVYFDHLAQAFLSGRLHLDPPPGTHDLSEFEGRWYVPFPPLPALLMLPLVGLLGLEHVNSVYFSIGVGAGTAALLWSLLDSLAVRRVVRLGPAGRIMLIAFFLLGTVHAYVAVEGSVWFLSQTCTVFFVALAANCAIWFRSPLPASLALGLAMAARPHVLLCWPLLVGLARLRDDSPDSIRQSWLADCRAALTAKRRWIIGSLVGPALTIVSLSTYNYARFRDPLDFGYLSQKIEAGLMAPLFMEGQFSLAHVPRNLHVLLVQGRVRDHWTGRLVPSDVGMSVILTSPALLWIFFALPRRNPAVRGAWMAAGLTLVPLLLYYNTGWRQFGYRFILDLIVPLVVLLAVAAGRRINPVLGVLLLVSIAVNLLGAFWWFTEVSLPS